MIPKKSKQKNPQKDLLRPELTKIIDPGHGLVKMARAVNWDRMDEVFSVTFIPDQGRPGISTRLMVSFH
jgi:IS5 family transposase